MDAHREATSRRLRWGAVSAALLAYVALALAVARGASEQLDGPFQRVALAGRSEAVTSVVLFVTELGALWTLAALTLGIGLALWRVHRRSSLYLLLGAGGAGLLNLGAKWLAQRPRPSGLSLAEASGFSFPSGHAMASMGCFLALYFVTRRTRPGVQWVVLAAALIATGAVGASRVYLGVHYPSDVLAGWSLGAAWVIALTAWYRREPPAA